jgi:hypothetical protein
MKNIISKALVVLALGDVTAFAADNANQQLHFQVQPFVNITLADASLNLVISSIPLGGQGEATASSSYALVNNKLDQKITASLDSAMPTATTLSLTAGAPAGATAAGAVTLSATAVDVASNVDRVNESGISLAYTFNATEAAATDAFVRTVTYTVLAM